MKKSISIINNEKGSLILIVVLILISVTLIGIFALNTTTVETQIAANDKFHKMAFYNADSGIYSIPKIISEAVNNKATPNLATPAYLNPALASLYTYLDLGNNDDGPASTFYRELAGFNPWDAAPDITFILGSTDIVQVDVERQRMVNLGGGGAEFASAAEGAGVSLNGIFYGLDSFGTAPGRAQSNIGAVYLKVIGVAGGM